MLLSLQIGAEANVGKSCSVPLALACPPAAPLNLVGEGAAAAAADVEKEPHMEYNKSLHAPGALRMLHTTTENVLSSLEHFVEAKALMKQMSKALGNQPNRAGIVATCCCAGLARFHAWKFERFQDKLIGWRC